MQETPVLPEPSTQTILMGPPVSPVLIVDDMGGMERQEVKPSRVQTILAESTFDAISAFAAQPSHPSKIDLLPILSQTVAVLSSMAMELGIIFRVRIRTENALIFLDAVKLRRSINVLLVHLLTISSPQAFVTIQLESRMMDGRPGYSILLTSNQTVLTEDSGLDSNALLNMRPEISICRQITQQQGGRLSAERNEIEALTFHLWLPA